LNFISTDIGAAARSRTDVEFLTAIWFENA
jgi:hypothetical protein